MYIYNSTCTSLTQVNEVNLLRVPAKDAYAYGCALLDLLFTKQEQKTSVVTKTKKSEKPPLDPKRVEKLFGEFILPWHCLFMQTFHTCYYN